MASDSITASRGSRSRSVMYELNDIDPISQRSDFLSVTTSGERPSRRAIYCQRRAKPLFSSRRFKAQRRCLAWFLQFRYSHVRTSLELYTLCKSTRVSYLRLIYLYFTNTATSRNRIHISSCAQAHGTATRQHADERQAHRLLNCPRGLLVRVFGS